MKFQKENPEINGRKAVLKLDIVRFICFVYYGLFVSKYLYLYLCNKQIPLWLVRFYGFLLFIRCEGSLNSLVKCAKTEIKIISSG